MWYPRNSLFSTENFSSLATGDIYLSDFNKVNNLGGILSLRNISTSTGVVIPPGQPWPAIDWKARFDLSLPWSLNSGSLGQTGGTVLWNPAYSTTSLTGTTSVNLKPLPIFFDTGYLVECGLFIASQTGITVGRDNLYGVVIQQGTGTDAYYDSLLLTTYPRHGLWLNSGHPTEAFVPVENLDSSILNFRIGRRSDQIQIVADNGYSIVVTGTAPRTGILPFSGVSVGNISSYMTGQSTDPAARIELNHLYVKYPVSDIGGDFIADTDYFTGDIDLISANYPSNPGVVLAELLTWPKATLGKFTPQKPIKGYSSLNYKLVGDSTDGLLVLSCVFDNGGYVVVGVHGPIIPAGATGGIYSQTSASIPELANYTGSLTIEAYFAGKYGSYKPTLALDYFTVCVNADDHEGLAYIYPEYGSSDGDYPVVLAIDPNSRAHLAAPNKYESGLTSLVLLQGQETSYSDEMASSLVTIKCNSGTSFIRGYLGESPRSFDRFYLESASSVEQVFTTFSTPPVEGINYRTLQVQSRGKLIASTGFGYFWASGAGTGTNFTGLPTGTGGYWLNPYYASGLTPSPTDQIIYEPVVMIPPDSNGAQFNVGQRVRGREGYGFQTQVVDGANFKTGDLIIEADLSCAEGGVGIGVIGYDANNIFIHTGQSREYVVYPSQRFSSTQKVRTLLPRPTGKFLVNFIGLTPGTTGNFAGNTTCDFSVSDINIGTQSGMGVDIANTVASSAFESTSTYASGCTMDLWVKPNGFGYIGGQPTGIGASIDPVLQSLVGPIDHSVLLKTYALSTLGLASQVRTLAIDRAGYPVFSALSTGHSANKSLEIKSNIGLEVNKWNHVAVSVNPVNSVYLYVNGELAGYDSGDTAVSYGGSAIQNLSRTTIIGSRFCGHIEYSRVRNYPRTPAQIRVFDSFSAPPRFNTRYDIGNEGTFAYYKFGRGTIIDYSPSGNHCIVPESGDARIYTERSVEGVVGDGIAFNNNYGYAQSIKNVVYTGTGYSVGGYFACLTDETLTPKIFSLGTSKLSIENNKIVYRYSGSSFTGITNVVNPFAYRPFMIAHQYVSGSNLTGTHIWGYVGTGQGTGNIGTVTEFSGFSTGGTRPYFNDRLYLGHDSSNPLDVGDVFLDQIMFHTGILRNLDHIDYRSNLRRPEEYVYLDGSRLSTGRVGHIGIYEKEIFMPARTDFSYSGATVNIMVDSDAGRLDIAPAFTYINTRYLVADPVTKQKIEDISEEICKTKSPFRIGSRVPNGAVNLAYMTTTPITPESSMSMMDGADSITQNLVNAVRTYELTDCVPSISNGYTNNVLTITGQINTDDFVVSSYAMSRPDSDFPAPLFYYHRLGNESLYPILLGGTNTASGDFVDMRNSITITDENGIQLSLEDFPWDIRMSKYKEDGTILPDNVYSVDLLTRDKYIYNRTLFANYNAANPHNGYQPIRNHSEVINTVPIYRRIGYNSAVTGETFTVQKLPGLVSLNANTNLSSSLSFSINMRTGEWTPYLHDMYISKEEMPEV
jgi:hypothetical protein